MRFISSIDFTYYKGMKFSLKAITVLILVLFSFAGCEKPIEPDFSFNPEMPKAGQKVTFTNLTEGGEHWNWTFGDGSKSITKNPVYTYKKPGKYDITLRADSNDNYITTKTIVVYDTVPSIYLAKDTVGYYQSVTLQVLAYNPYGYTMTYEWSFSGNAQGADVVSGKSTKATPVIFFTKKGVEEVISLKVTVGDSVYKDVSKKIFVNDVPSRSMIFAGTDGKIYRQRIYLNGLEEPFVTNISNGGGHPVNIQTSGDYLYIFNAGNDLSTDKTVLEGKPGSGNIRKVNMANAQSVELIHNRDVSAVHGFYHGWVNNGKIYWTDFADFVYRMDDNNQVAGSFIWKGNTNDQASVPYYLLKPDRLGYFGNGLNFGQKNGGIYFYDQVYFWAKGGSGKGIYRFTPADILTANVSGQGVSPSLGAILTDYAVHAFRIDHINQKIYFSVVAPADKAGLWVANLTGTNPVRIDDSPVDNPALYISSILIDNVTNRVYWSYRAPAGLSEAHFQLNPHHRTGVKYVRLAKNFTVDKDIQYMPGNISALGIALDETPR